MNIAKKTNKFIVVMLAFLLMFTVMPIKAYATGTDPVSIAEGEPVTINWSSSTAGTVQNVVSGSTVIPESFTLWVEGTSVSVTRAVGSGTAVALTSDGSEVVTDANNVSSTMNMYTIQTDEDEQITLSVVISTSAYGHEGTYTVTCAKTNAATEGTYPQSVRGYLPVGQFARPNSFGWGCLFTDNTNVYSSSKTAKFTNGYVSTGVSLGMAGGYIEFDMGEGKAIYNDTDNPYGIDFIIYGNAFMGNPEAASVKVSNDGTNWYELAGSRYYTDREYIANLSYIKISSANTTIGGKSFTKAGVYYSKDYVPGSYDDTAANSAIGAATWYCIPAIKQQTVNGETTYTYYDQLLASDSNAATVGTGYWPEQGNSENYEQVYNLSGDVSDVVWTTTGSAPVITYQNVSIVPDDAVYWLQQSPSVTSPSQSDSTSVYQFGYADIHSNGSNYGTAVNPYTIATNGTGGDGFDISWAVRSNGTPISLDSVRYVRVYSSVLFNAGIFGETSAEVCGLYVANGTTSETRGEVNISLTLNATDGTTQALAISPENVSSIIRNLNQLATHYGSENGKTYTGYTLTVTPTNSSSIIYVNENAYTTGSFTVTNSLPTSTTDYRIIVQAGTAEPFVCLFRFI